MSFRVAGAERAVQFKVVGVLEESAADGEQDILQRKIKYKIVNHFDRCVVAHLELMRLIDDVEIGLDGQGLLQTLLEKSLEGDNLLNVAEESVDFGRREKRFLLQRLQVIFQQVIQMLQPGKETKMDYNIVNEKNKATSLYLDISPFSFNQLEDAFLELLSVGKLPIRRQRYRLRRGDTAGGRGTSNIGRGRRRAPFRHTRLRGQEKKIQS